MHSRRVVITGMGAVTPLGISVPTFWQALLEGRSGISAVTHFDVSEFDVKIGGGCYDFDPNVHVDRKVVKRMDRFAQFALCSSREAFRQSGLDMGQVDPYRVAVIIGSGIGGLNELEEQHSRLEKKGPGRVSAFTIPKLMVNAAAANISIDIGARGDSHAVATACASASNAMGQALELIRHNTADVVVTGGSEAALTPLALSAFASMKALSSRNDDPERASRPFDRDRDGFVLGEGAGLLIFEELEHAKRRGAPILAEVVGFGASADAGHITQPSDDGEGAARAMQAAFDDAGLNAEDVEYINAHGTSTPLGDVAETVAIKKVYGPASDKVVVSSTKSSIGHLLGASGGVEMVACTKVIIDGVIPPTINLDNLDEKCNLDYCPNTPRNKQVRYAMSNSFGFGGHNACVVVGRFDG